MTVRLEELLAASTPGPWEIRDEDAIGNWDVRQVNDPGIYYLAMCVTEPDARLIALAPEMARLLIEWAGDDPERRARLGRLGDTA